MLFDHVCKICEKKFSSSYCIPFCNDCETPKRTEKYLKLVEKENRLFQSTRQHINFYTGEPWSYLSNFDLFVIKIMNFFREKRIRRLQSTKY
jgi:hypothetical protein